MSVREKEVDALLAAALEVLSVPERHRDPIAKDWAVRGAAASLRENIYDTVTFDADYDDD